MTSPSFLQPKHFDLTFNQIPRGRIKDVAFAVSVTGGDTNLNPAIAEAVERAFKRVLEERGLTLHPPSSAPQIRIHANLVWQKNAYIYPAFFVNKFYLEVSVLNGGTLLTDVVWARGIGCVAACPSDEIAGELAGEVAAVLAIRF